MSSSPNTCITTKVTFVPVFLEKVSRDGRRSTVKPRISRKNKLIPSNALTCVQVKNFQTSIGASNLIILCGNCGMFEHEKIEHKRFRRLKDNNSLTAGHTHIPREYRCRTLWIAEGHICPSSSLVTPSPHSITSSSLPDPPILSTCHSNASPLREKRTTRNYSTGRWSLSYSIQNEQDQSTNQKESKKRRHQHHKTTANKASKTSKRMPSPPNSSSSDCLGAVVRGLVADPHVICNIYKKCKKNSLWI